MKKIIFSFFTYLFISSSFCLHAQEADPMKAWQDFMTPSAAHKRLAKEVGNWEGEVNQWADPTQPPTKTKAKIAVSMTLNGLYQVGNFSTVMMGKPMSGISTTGYDNAKKEYVMTWIDNMGSGIIMMKGFYDEGTKTMNLKGIQTDPISAKDIEIREEVIYHNDNSYTMSMYAPGMDGKEMKVMEGTFNRVAKPKVPLKKK